ncbi:Aquaporin Z [Symbiodinium microadriaticum]|uniref:Aquaporin Z n=1 Tax=Symbiodinium microadriaticum TaxID=2951 RepID=A0A1Q9DKN9_SYMMI|nr:Aquaporin Z [Symbiodinium microadriaticum]
MSGCRSSPLLVNVFFLARSARIHSSRCPSSFIVLIVNLMNDVVIMVIILIIIVIIVIIITSNAITISSLIMVSVSGHFDGVTQHQDSSGFGGSGLHQNTGWTWNGVGTGIRDFGVRGTRVLDTLALLVGVCEYFYTFMLTFVVLNVAAAKKNVEEKGQYYGLAIGFTVIAGAYGGGFISGGCFNPAVALALDITSALVYSAASSYIVFELLAAVISAFIFSKIRPEDFQKPLSTGKATEQLLSEFVGTFMLARMIYATGDVSGRSILRTATLSFVSPGVTLALLR